MIHATLETPVVQSLEEGALRNWLRSQGFNVRNPIKRTENGDGTTLFEQFPAPSFKVRPDASEFIDTAAEDRNKREWEKDGLI